MKTAPLYRSLKIEGTNKQAKSLAFEGIRSEESVMRSNYERIGRGVKHDTVINARPILNWSTIEVFLYLFKYNLPVNVAYRLGKARVGCVICPYSTAWDDMIINKCFPDALEPFLSRIRQWSKSSGVKDVDDYVKERKWKFRASGNILGKQSNFVVEKSTTDFVAKLTSPQVPLESWLPVIADYVITSEHNDIQKGELKFRGSVYEFEINNSKEKTTIFTLFNANNPELQSLLRRILNKSTYCINCEACEVECPSGALSVLPVVNVDREKCIHCHKCLNFHERGCVVATSVATTIESKMKAKSGIDRYNTFGLKEDWVDIFFSDPEYYFKDNNSGLGVKQIPAMTNWLKEAEIIDDKKNLTELGCLLYNTYRDDPDLVWEIIWVNLVKNSFICRWFAAKIKPGVTYNKKSLVDMFIDEFQSTYGKRTVENAIAALLGTFSNSPIGERFGLYENPDKGTATRSYCQELSDVTVAYSMYCYAESHNSKILSVSDLYREDVQDGLNVEFGYPKEYTKKKLRNLNSANNRVLIAELNMGLESISLREDLSPLSVLKQLLQ